MPIYEYYCPQCGETFEKRQSFSAEPVADCVGCDFTGVRRKISTPAILFKGSGFYVTDNRSKSSSLSSSNDSNGSKDSSDSSNSSNGSNGSKDSDSKDSKEKSEKSSGDSSSDKTTKTETKSKAKETSSSS